MIDLLERGETLNPEVRSSGAPREALGRHKQSRAFNLLKRLRAYRLDVWRFMTDKNVHPPTPWPSKPCAWPRSSKKYRVAFVPRMAPIPSSLFAFTKPLCKSSALANLTVWSALSRLTSSCFNGLLELNSYDISIKIGSGRHIY